MIEIVNADGILNDVSPESAVDSESNSAVRKNDGVIKFVWNPSNVNQSGDFKEFARLSYLWEHNPVLLLYFSEGVCLQISQNNGDKVLYSPGSTIKYNTDEDTFEGGI